MEREKEVRKKRRGERVGNERKKRKGQEANEKKKNKRRGDRKRRKLIMYEQKIKRKIGENELQRETRENSGNIIKK